MLQVAAAAGCADISTNDAICGAVWTLFCHLRGRPLPGQQPTAPAAGGGTSPPGCLALAVDLRRNGLNGRLPFSFAGNASWGIGVAARRPHRHPLPGALARALGLTPFIQPPMCK